LYRLEDLPLIYELKASVKENKLQ